MAIESDTPEPVAYAVLGDGYEYVSLLPEMCVAWAGENGGRTVPLYRSPALTDAERKAIREACDEGRWWPKDYHHIHTLRGLLERLG
jgi:hypothetical protein